MHKSYCTTMSIDWKRRNSISETEQYILILVLIKKLRKPLSNLLFFCNSDNFFNLRRTTFLRSQRLKIALKTHSINFVLLLQSKKKVVSFARIINLRIDFMGWIFSQQKALSIRSGINDIKNILKIWKWYTDVLFYIEKKDDWKTVMIKLMIKIRAIFITC